MGVTDIIDDELPCCGSPLLALDPHNHPLMISFDPENEVKALLSGLSAWDEVQANHAWLIRLHPLLSTESIKHHLRLLVLSPRLPPGVNCLSITNPAVTFCTFRIVRINSETAAIIEPYPTSHVGMNKPSPPPATEEDLSDEYKTLGLNEEEAAYFGNLK